MLRCEAYEESRKVKMLRFVPDRVLEMNIRSKQRLKVFDEAKYAEQAKEMENEDELENIKQGAGLTKESPLAKEFISDIFLKESSSRLQMYHTPTTGKGTPAGV